MDMSWISKDNGTYHFYSSLVSICNLENLIKPFVKKYANGCNQNRCEICSGVLKSNHKKIKIEEKRLEIKKKIFKKKYAISPVDALINLLGHKETCRDNPLGSLSAKDFEGILPDVVLSEGIKEKRIGFDDDGLICPLEVIV